MPEAVLVCGGPESALVGGVKEAALEGGERSEGVPEATPCSSAILESLGGPVTERTAPGQAELVMLCGITCVANDR